MSHEEATRAIPEHVQGEAKDFGTEPQRPESSMHVCLSREKHGAEAHAGVFLPRVPGLPALPVGWSKRDGVLKIDPDREP